MIEPLVELDDKVVLITGAAGGQGAEHARLCSRLGATVVLADLGLEAVEKVASDLPGPSLAVALDVSHEAAWDDALARVGDRFGRVDVLVNNAGLYRLGGLEDLERGQIEAAMAVNVIGPVLGMQRVVPLMRERGGSIINVSSVAGLGGYPGAISYSASKWALRGASRSAAKELGAHGIRVNCVCPGAIDTQMISEETRAGRGSVASQPIARAGRPEEVSALIAFLASDASSYCTGQDFVIDGGQSS
ncbi:SDR family oxidoreductase [Nocardioides sp. JQ2195]|uniref:SDR family NAD(P)-dependent oxidoreductase n=1 Tax=Nocardioides sp. JQ2195 TaxID=2592334 RepID=UPI00143EE6A2|nr:SDR family NAD(P)-dependent oxidoreductase [Nocardioides sp. JQ2195]QIX26540.1 SDR family oxidoreductase [Nocardioides sp. JQ2195]